MYINFKYFISLSGLSHGFPSFVLDLSDVCHDLPSNSFLAASLQLMLGLQCMLVLITCLKNKFWVFFFSYIFVYFHMIMCYIYCLSFFPCILLYDFAYYMYVYLYILLICKRVWIRVDRCMSSFVFPSTYI